MEKKSRELVMAKLYFKNKDYKMAEKSFNEYLNMNPEDVSALKLLAQVYEQNKRYDKAFEMYERCYLAEPDRTGVLLDICRILLMNEIWLDHVDYRKWLNLAIKAFPTNPIIVNFKAFLSTLPQDEQTSPVKTTPSRSNLSEDLAGLILEKLSLLEKKLKNIEDKLDKAEDNMQNNVPSHPSLNMLSSEGNCSQLSLHWRQALNHPRVEEEENIVKNSASLNASSTSSPQTKTTVATAPVAAPLPTTTASSLFSPITTSTAPITTPSFPSLSTTPSSFNFSPLGNPFEASLKKINLPLEGSWTQQPTLWGQPFSRPKSEHEENKEEDDDNGVVPNEELAIEQTCDMTPIEIKTGEEEEDKLFEHRAKLFRFKDKEFKERGLGNVKVLKHKSTGKGRLIMRRDATGLVCLNCCDITNVERVRPNQLKWAGVDASDNQPEPSIFLLKLKTPEVTDNFQSHLDALFKDSASLNASPTSSPKTKTNVATAPAVSPPKTTTTTITTTPSLFSPLTTPSLFSPLTTSTAPITTHSFPSLSTTPSSFNFSPLGNPFEASLKKINLPLEGSWTQQPTLWGQPFSRPKSEHEENKEEDDDNGVVPNEELAIEQTCDMTPIEIKTGEEEEDKLFEHRAKLFRFKDKEFKERGLGNVKVLKHKSTGKGRLIMRRDATGLVCLNCWDVTNIERVRPNQLKWAGVDASDNQPEPSIFLLKLKTPEVTDNFQSHLEALFKEPPSPNATTLNAFHGNDGQAKDTQRSDSSSEKSDVELVDPKLDQTLVDKARLFKLPDLFYHKLKNQECGGCNGCEEDD